MMRQTLLSFALTAGLVYSSHTAAEVTRYPLPNGSTFPIARAVEVSAGTNLIYHSGNVPSASKPDAEKGSRAYYGDTETQVNNVLDKLEASLKGMGLGFKDVIKMTVFLVGDPDMDGKMDFSGMMKAYEKRFGTTDQPNLPARSAVQVAGLAGGPGMLVEIEMVVARPD